MQHIFQNFKSEDFYSMGQQKHEPPIVYVKFFFESICKKKKKKYM